MKSISRQRRDELIDALRRGTVPMQSLDLLAVGLDRFAETLLDELRTVQAGGAKFKAVRGEYGTGKTFFSRWLADRARQMAFATSEVQISETETPLHRLETVYRRLMERLGTSDTPTGAFRNILDGWFFTLEEDVLAEGNISPNDHEQLLERSNALMEKRLMAVTQSAPMFSVALRGYHTARSTGDTSLADGIAAWLAGQPNVAASIKQKVGVKGDIDHFGAMSFLQGLLTVLRDSGRSGLYLVLDEVETIQRVRSDVRDKSLNALRQLIDDIDSGRFPGLYLLITGTTAFYEGPQGVQRLEPLAQRLHVDFLTDAAFDNPRAVQVRLSAFDFDRLCEVGRKVRDLYAMHANAPDRIAGKAQDSYIGELAQAVTGRLGGKIGVAPRIFLKKLVADILDRIDQFPEFDPRKNYALTIAEAELSPIERQAIGVTNVDDIELEM
jgi:hypothetical protein